MAKKFPEACCSGKQGGKMVFSLTGKRISSGKFFFLVLHRFCQKPLGGKGREIQHHGMFPLLLGDGLRLQNLSGLLLFPAPAGPAAGNQGSEGAGFFQSQAELAPRHVSEVQHHHHRLSLGGAAEGKDALVRGIHLQPAEAGAVVFPVVQGGKLPVQLV